MKKASITFGIIIGLCILLLATLLLTRPASLNEAFQLGLATLLLHICGAILFLFAIKSFRPSLRSAYRFMAAGALMLVVGIIIITVIQSSGLGEQAWTTIPIELPFTFMAVAFYVGSRAFARLIGVRSIILKAKLVYVICMVAGIVVGLVFGLSSGSQFFDSLVALRFFNILLFILSAVLAYKVWQLASPFYKPAFTWLALFLGLTVFHTICGFLRELSWMQWFNEVSTVIYLIDGFILSTAAWQFNRLAHAEKSGTFIHSNPVGNASAKTSVDIVIFLASFASNPTQVDPYLDTVRNITSSVTSRKLSEAEQIKLAEVYLRIEDFLVNKEPLRRFNQKDLRQMIDLQFKEAVNEPAFWRRVPVETAQA